MRTIFYNKFFSGISISFLISFLLKQFFNSQLSFVYTMSFFGSLYLLLSWVTYLKSDGIYFFQKKYDTSIKKYDRFSYKKKGVYNMDEDDINNDVTETQKFKAVMFAYLCCSAVLFIISQLYYYFIIKAVL